MFFRTKVSNQRKVIYHPCIVTAMLRERLTGAKKKVEDTDVRLVVWEKERLVFELGKKLSLRMLRHLF